MYVNGTWVIRYLTRHPCSTRDPPVFKQKQFHLKKGGKKYERWENKATFDIIPPIVPTNEFLKTIVRKIPKSGLQHIISWGFQKSELQRNKGKCSTNKTVDDDWITFPGVVLIE